MGNCPAAIRRILTQRNGVCDAHAKEMPTAIESTATPLGPPSISGTMIKLLSSDSQHSSLNDSSTTDTTTFIPSSPKYNVFITHAAEDKDTIAIPLRHKLKQGSFTAFIDNVDITSDTDQKQIGNQPKRARIAIVVLSPEFMAQKLTMMELKCFLSRREKCVKQRKPPEPVIIPFFYRWGVDDFYDELPLGRTDEPEANITAIKKALGTIYPIVGIRNDIKASNDPSPAMSTRRDALLEEICRSVKKTLRPTPHRPTETANTAPSTATAPQPVNHPLSANAPYKVYIIHAAEDKVTIAIPLRNKLVKHRINTFVYEHEFPPGTDAEQILINAVKRASIAVVVLSPEFIARKWTMKELMRFLKRRKECAEANQPGPVIIPFFYRLGLGEICDEPRLDRKDKDGNELYRISRFSERQNRGEPEATDAKIKETLKTLRDIPGIANYTKASNEPSHTMTREREKLVQAIFEKVRESLPMGSTDETNNALFRANFEVPYEISQLIFDFDARDEVGTPESKLLGQILDKSRDRNRVIAVQGIGGTGKTALLLRITSLDKIQQRFIDGIYFMSLGADASRGKVMEVMSVAVQSSSRYEEPANAIRSETDYGNAFDRFRSWFKWKSCLFVVDDVFENREVPLWTIQEFLRLHLTGKDSKVLLATRSAVIASKCDDVVTMEPRDPLSSESRRIFFRYSGIEPEPDQDDDKRVVNEILSSCRGLPLDLASAGRAVSVMNSQAEKKGFAAYHEFTKRLDASMQNNTNDGESARLMISLGLLESEHPKMHRRLSVLTTDSRISMTTLKHLWGLKSEEQAEVVVREFQQVGLAEVEYERTLVPGSLGRGVKSVEVLRLHDSIYKFAVTQTQISGEEKDGHRALLESYGTDLLKKEGCREWWHTSLRADGYIHANLCRHLLAAWEFDELFKLLLSPQWASRQLEVNGILFLEADLMLGLKTAQNLTRTPSVEIEKIAEAIQLISQAVTLSSGFVAGNIEELYFQLHGRLHGYRKNSKINGFLRWIDDDAMAPLALCRSYFLGAPGEANTRIVNILAVANCLVLIMMKDQQFVACGCSKGQITILDLERSQVIKSWYAHDKGVLAISVSRNGTRLVSGSEDGTAKVWSVENIKSPTLLRTFGNHTDAVTCTAVLDEKNVVTGSDDGTARVWDMDTAGKAVSKCFTSHGHAVKCVAVLEDGRKVVVGGMDKKIRLWNVTTYPTIDAEACASFDGHQNLVRCLAVSSDKTRMLSGSDDRTVRLWDVNSRQQVTNSFETHNTSVNTVALSKDGRRFVSGCRDGMIRVWDSELEKEVCDPLQVHESAVTEVLFQADGDRIVSSSLDGMVREWDVRIDSVQRLEDRHEKGVTGVSFFKDGRSVVSGSYDKTLRIWDAESGRQVGDPLKGHTRYVTDVAASPDGKFFVSVSEDMTVRVWDIEHRILRWTLEGHTDTICCVAVTPKGDHAVTGSKDRTARIWNIRNGSHVTVKWGNATIRRVIVSDDGARIFAVDLEGNVLYRVGEKRFVKWRKKEDAWKLSRGEILRILKEPTGDCELSIPLEGRKIVYGKRPGQVLATMEANVWSWALSPNKQTLCVGLANGQVGFVKLKTKD